MKPPPFRYHTPTTLDEAVSLLGSLENARLLAGGQSLMPMLNMRFATPDHLIDLNRIEALTGIQRVGEALEIGAMTRQRDLEFSPLVAETCPLLHEALGYIGHRQTRNRGTIGGSLCHLDPAAELVCVACVFDAEMDVVGLAGARTIPFAGFPLDYLTPALEPGEMLRAIRLPLWPKRSGHAFVEFARRHGDFAIVSAAALMLLDADGRIARVSLALGGMGVAPLRAEGVERRLLGETPSAALFAELAETCRAIEVADDAYVPALYRQRLAVTLARQALTRAWERSAAPSAKRMSA